MHQYYLYACLIREQKKHDILQHSQLILSRKFLSQLLRKQSMNGIL